MIKSILGKTPKIHPSAYVADGAAVIGDVTIDKDASIWFNAVVRGDLAPITVGECSNVQDNCTLHVDPGLPLVIGKRVTIGHNAVVHSATIGDDVLIGMNATVLNGAKIESGSVIGAGALVTENSVIPAGSVAVGVPAKVIKTVDEATAAHIRENAEGYALAAKAYKSQNDNIQPVDLV